MSFESIELHEYDSEIFELYKITRNGRSWYYNSSDVDITYSGNNYISKPIVRDSVKYELQTSKAQFSVKVPIDLNFLRDYIASPPTTVTEIEILQGHFGSAEVRQLYLARLVSVSFDVQSASLTLESIYTSIKRPCLNLKYQKNCAYDLYGRGCGVNKDDFKLETSVTVVSATQLSNPSLAGFADGYFTGGLAVWDNYGVITNRFIMSHAGDTIVIELPFVGLDSSATLKLYPGCDRTLATCDSKFQNSDNYGGQPFMPTLNPFTGTLVF